MICLALVGADGNDIDWAARRAQLSTLSPDESTRLLHNRERLALLPAAEQAKLRKLADEVDRDPQRDRLRHVMNRYYQWLKKLGPVQRAELLELSPEARLAKIKQLRSEQQQRLAAESAGGEPLSVADLEHILKWIENQAWKNRAALLTEVKPDRRAQFDQLDASKQRRAIMALVAQRWRNGKPGSLGEVTARDLHNLVEKLSPAAQNRFKQATSSVEQRQLLRHWGQLAARHRVETAVNSRKPPDYTEEELNHFFEHDLSAEQRERLLALPPDRLQRELRQLYYDDQRRLEDTSIGAEPPAGPSPAAASEDEALASPSQPEKPAASEKPGKAKRHPRVDSPASGAEASP
jgi:hypothetical protein